MKIPLHKVFMPPQPGFDEMMGDLRRVLSSGWIGEGPQVAKFESVLKPILGSDNVSLVNACTSALTLALRIAGVGPGSEVITTALTCSATNLPIVLAGASPVWADIDPKTGNILPSSIRERITPRTRAIMVVHWGGVPVDLDDVRVIADAHGIKVIEDAAHALGATYKGKPIGSHSDFVCFSLQAIKHVTAGDGGILVCRSSVDHARARSLRWFGIDRERRVENDLGYADWNVVEAGYKFNLNDIAATIGLAQIPYLPDILSARRANALTYSHALNGLKRIEVPPPEQSNTSACWLYTVLLNDSGAQPDFIRYLSDSGIASGVVHMRNDRGGVFSPYRRDDLPGLDDFSSRMVCIPCGDSISEADRARIIDVIQKEAW